MNDALAPRPTVPLSALQHYVYCPRQCALIHVEDTFRDNLHTRRGHRTHRRAHREGREVRHGVTIERSLTLFHRPLGLVGKSDLVEFPADGAPVPVEYKSGAAEGEHPWDAVQLAGQALCLEAMFGCPVPAGVLYYASSNERVRIDVDDALRDRVRDVVTAYQERKEARVTHPCLDREVPLGLVPHLQSRLLARYLRGDLDEYPAYVHPR